MAVLPDYHQFDGLHWETGTLRNALDYQRVIAPHNGQPLSEAMLLGVSGGIAFGYFTFEYSGLPPQANLITRFTFEPLERIYQRLQIRTTYKQTSNPERAASDLLAAVEAGQPAIVWANPSNLPYNNLPLNQQLWGAMPVLVYGFDRTQDIALLADRARVTLAVSTTELALARSRSATIKHRLLTINAPELEQLPEAVLAGILDCITLFNGKPPRGPAANFGWAAYEKWACLITETKDKKSWARIFPPGAKMFAGLESALRFISTFGTEGSASRRQYADFLDEAAQVLEQPALHEVAVKFQTSARQWHALAEALMPDAISPFRTARHLILNAHRLFIEQGTSSLPERQALGQQLENLRAEMSQDFPLSETETTHLRADLAARIMEIRALEQEAIQDLQIAIQ